jgi:large subunit ribosomal protein L11
MAAPASKSKKEVTGFIKLQIPAGKANPAPPIGPALGQKGVNIMEFCKSYNEATKDKGNTVIPVEITVYKDRSFSFILKTPPTAVLIREIAKIPKGSATPNTAKVGKLTKAQVKVIAQTKLPDLNTTDLEAAMRTVAGAARSMGVDVVD